ncbi:hypothetical protein Tco_1119251 [Tanacetum coccineum]
MSICTSTNMIQYLLAAADRFDLDRLKQLCEAKLCEEVNAYTVATTLSLADQHCCSQLKAICLKFAVANLGEWFSWLIADQGTRKVSEVVFSVITEFGIMVDDKKNDRACGTRSADGLPISPQTLASNSALVSRGFQGGSRSGNSDQVGSSQGFNSDEEYDRLKGSVNVNSSTAAIAIAGSKCVKLRLFRVPVVASSCGKLRPVHTSLITGCFDFGFWA